MQILTNGKHNNYNKNSFNKHLYKMYTLLNPLVFQHLNLENTLINNAIKAKFTE